MFKNNKLAASLLLTCLCWLSAPASAAILSFAGDYAPGNWTLDTDGQNGSVDTSTAPQFITLAGSDGDYESGVVTLFTVNVLTGGTLEFDWVFLSLDEDGASYDPFGYFLNAVFVQLSDDGGLDSQSGSESVAVAAGDVFGFWIDSTDGCCGGSMAQIGSDLPGFAVPTPATLAVFGLGLIGLAAARRRVG